MAAAILWDSKTTVKIDSTEFLEGMEYLHTQFYINIHIQNNEKMKCLI